MTNLDQETFRNLEIGARRFRIVPKRDFGSGSGFWCAGAGTVGTERYGWVKRGFVVTDGVCNIMPGATWFRSVADAMEAIKVYWEARGDGAEFWSLWQARKAERA